ncbi:hypothetical protein MPL3356_340091 [Mesorhizobium plurifarium]|uniref:Uncharacterized protein n=1 Tax=Mesorhizobium plurifarium TaxID=69974 RepID=A0A090E2A2_MESPL|nr:hypothetical protein MPL3356_340091 [Mesorhizobium plurifarium]
MAKLLPMALKQFVIHSAIAACNLAHIVERIGNLTNAIGDFLEALASVGVNFQEACYPTRCDTEGQIACQPERPRLFRERFKFSRPQSHTDYFIAEWVYYRDAPSSTNKRIIE